MYYMTSYVLRVRISLHAIVGIFKLTPGVNFTNVFCAAFTLVDHENLKKPENLTVFFMLLGSVCVKAVQRTLMKLSLGGVKDHGMDHCQCFRPERIVHSLQ